MEILEDEEKSFYNVSLLECSSFLTDGDVRDTESSSQSNECENCSDEATVHCEDCQHYYCQQCSFLRHKNPKRMGHSIEKLAKCLSFQQSEGTSHQATMICGIAAQNFGIACLHAWQVRIIEAALFGKNTLVVQPTGSGKSLCYTIPPLHTGKTVVVITPTISLMTDQVEKLSSRGLSATLLGSAQKEKNVLQEVETGKYQIVFTTPESFYAKQRKRPIDVFLNMAANSRICLIAVDEAHLIVTWGSFRPEYKYLESLTSDFPSIPVMALTATATPTTKEKLLSMLGNPVTEVSSVNKPNISLHAHDITHLPRNGSPLYYSGIADILASLICKDRAVVYTDFVKDVAPLAIALREKGLHSWSYHGKNMSSHDKVKVVEDWCPENSSIQVMVCTSAFGMGIDVPNVDLVVRIGCPPTLEELVQEFGRAGRDGRQAKGILLFSEYDLQHVLYWCKDDLLEEQEEKLRLFQEVWRFALSHLHLKCRRQVILNHFEDSQIDQKASKICCDVCSMECSMNTDDRMEEIQAVCETAKDIPGKGEKKIAEWLRGYKKDGNKSNLNSFGSGIPLHLSERAWRICIRQAWLSGYLNRNMLLGHGQGRIKTVVFNTYSLSKKGEEFLVSPTSITLPVSFADSISPLSTKDEESTSVALTRKSKGVHLLPTLRQLLSSEENWFEIKNTEDYHYPGKFSSPYPQRLGFSKDITALPFYVKVDQDFMFNDIQLSKGKPRAPRKVKFSINGKEEDLWYRLAPCSGNKECDAEDCSYALPIRENKSCPDHPNASLIVKKECPVEFVYVWPENKDDKRRWLSGITRTGDLQSDNLHNHRLLGPSKIPSKVVHDIHEALELDPTLTTHDIVTGRGLLYLPGAASLAATHKGRVKNIRSAALRESKDERNPGFVILSFEDAAIRFDKENVYQLGNSKHMDEYSEKGHSYIRNYSLNPTFTWVLAMSPIMSKILSNAEFAEVDATFNASAELEYLLNMVCFDYDSLQWTVVARVRMNKLNAEAYASAFEAIFSCAKEAHPHFEVGRTLKGIITDWSDAQLRGLQIAIGEEETGKLVKGCQVHYQRSVKRVSTKINMGTSSQEYKAFTTIAYAIPDADSEVTVNLLFDVLSGIKPVSVATKTLPQSSLLKNYQHFHNPEIWKQCTHWCEWWRRPYHLKMLCKCCSEMDPDQFASLPRSTNAVESYNRFGKSQHPLPLKEAMMLTYKEDMVKALEILAKASGLQVCYENQNVEARAHRSTQQNRARSKRIAGIRDDPDGPPDTQKSSKLAAQPQQSWLQMPPQLHLYLVSQLQLPLPQSQASRFQLPLHQSRQYLHSRFLFLLPQYLPSQFLLLLLQSRQYLLLLLTQF